jgi:hypothetical protein
MVDGIQFKRRDVFRRISEDPIVSEPKYTELIVTSEEQVSAKKRMFGQIFRYKHW